MAFQYEKICRLCLNSNNTYIVNIFNGEYNIVEKINDLLSLEVYPNDSFPNVICTDCFSNLVIFQEFKSICRNSDALLKKYQINKVENLENPTENSGGTKGNGKCKSIRNSEEMATRMKECALKKSITFVENMKSFYFLLNQIEEMEGTAVIIKEENLIPTVEMSIKNEVIYPPEEGTHQVLISGENNGTLHLNVVQVENTGGTEHKRKKRKNNKQTQPQHQQIQTQRKTVNINGENLEIIQNFDPETVAISNCSLPTTNIVVCSTATTSTGETIIVSQKPSEHNIQTIHSGNTLTLSPSTQTQTISIIPQIQYSCSECSETFNNTDTLRQHLWNNHQILIPFSTPTTIEAQYTPHHIQAVPVQIQTQSTSSLQPGTTTTIQPVQQYTFHPHKNFFENSEIPCLLCGMILRTKEELIKHMIKHTSGTSTIVTATATNLTTSNPSQTQHLQGQVQHQQSSESAQLRTSQDQQQQQQHHVIYECIKCSINFDNENTYKMHNEKFHPTVSS